MLAGSPLLNSLLSLLPAFVEADDLRRDLLDFEPTEDLLLVLLTEEKVTATDGLLPTDDPPLLLLEVGIVSGFGLMHVEPASEWSELQRMIGACEDCFSWPAVLQLLALPAFLTFSFIL
jgi:hypothetical protein